MWNTGPKRRRCWRKSALEISWEEKVRNKTVNLRMDEMKTVWNTIDNRSKKWIGYQKRNKNTWFTAIIEGKILRRVGKKIERPRLRAIS